MQGSASRDLSLDQSLLDVLNLHSQRRPHPVSVCQLFTYRSALLSRTAVDSTRPSAAIPTLQIAIMCQLTQLKPPVTHAFITARCRV